MALHIIATGGTFEKHYDEISGMLVFGDSHIPAIVRRARFSVPYTFETVCMLDSLDMQDSDRQDILVACSSTTAESVLIVHGTDTMRETAVVLWQDDCSDRCDDTVRVRQFGRIVQFRFCSECRTAVAARSLCGDERPDFRLATCPEESSGRLL